MLVLVSGVEKLLNWYIWGTLCLNRAIHCVDIPSYIMVIIKSRLNLVFFSFFDKEFEDMLALALKLQVL